VQFLDKVTKTLVCFFANCEGLVVVEIIDVAPDSIKRQLLCCVFVDNILELLSAVVAPSALMPAKGPLRRRIWVCEQSPKVFNHLKRVRDRRLLVCSNKDEVVRFGTGREHLDVDVLVGFVLLDPPVLGSCGVGKESNRGHGG